ncbi:uncharacterized protein DS421_4g118180 [Arachis hypogaea]|nr:uncharacterized protein DS421_4g118180 [Arachis hypogaea]
MASATYSRHTHSFSCFLYYHVSAIYERVRNILASPDRHSLLALCSSLTSSAWTSSVVLLVAGVIHQQQHKCIMRSDQEKEHSIWPHLKSYSTQPAHALHPTPPNRRNILPLPRLSTYSFLVHRRRWSMVIDSEEGGD